MSTRPELVANSRAVHGKAVAGLRRQGILPAVVYGHGHASESIQVDARAFDDVRRHHGRNTLVDLRVDGGRPRPVLVHAIADHPVKRGAIHVDFFLVKMTEEMTVEVPVVTTGLSNALDKLAGTLLHSLDTVRVRALPGDLPQTLEADISALVDFDSVIVAGDLPLPAKVQLVTEPTEVVLRVQPPRVDEFAAEAAAAAAEAPAGEGVEAGEEAVSEAPTGSEGS